MKHIFMTITSFQIKSARAALNLSRPELADNIGIHVRTIDKIENSKNFEAPVNATTLKKLTSYFIERGIKFLPAVDDDGIDGAGLRYFPISKDKKKES